MAWFQNSSARGQKSSISLISLVTAGLFHHAEIQEILTGTLKKVLFVEEISPQGLKPHSYRWDYARAKASILQNKPYPPKNLKHTVSKIKASIGHNVNLCRDDLTKCSV
jgi:hypothetical protein